MSDPGNFLSRWSRRKRDAAENSDETESPAASEQAVENERAADDDAPHDRAATPGDSAAPPAPTFDPASLPPIELITAGTDIRAFLAPGVPPDLARAALRRAWAADPKIRNFVGLADYDWDFNAPGSMAGFGPLEMTEELRQVVARIIGPAPSEDGIGRLSPASAEATSGQNSPQTNPSEHKPATKQDDDTIAIDQVTPVNTSDESGPCDELTLRDQENIATQYQCEKSETVQTIVRRSHGRALPK